MSKVWNKIYCHFYFKFSKIWIHLSARGCSCVPNFHSSMEIFGNSNQNFSSKGKCHWFQFGGRRFCCFSHSDSHKHIKNKLHEITLLMAELAHHSFMQQRKSFSFNMNLCFVLDCLSFLTIIFLFFNSTWKCWSFIAVTVPNTWVSLRQNRHVGIKTCSSGYFCSGFFADYIYFHKQLVFTGKL